ncbi:replication protein a 70 kda dna-binding subunit b [Nicotiana attenuata]|uniref:Replication protein a 70 kDa dna-binding subunit b n=1 Tax=Nicotiana attenuata TaxID=49451 RepID=A0A1J6J6L2_NICAT|nr:replication protein a 70 kda dna-binding subunit b [Nicotiana attenuata]
MTLQDEEENQVQAIMFNADIMHFEDLFDPFHTYLVSVAQVKDSSYLYGNSLNKFTWTIDRSTIVEPIENVTPPEDPLPPPTRLTITAFDTFEYQPKESEFDVLAIVINGGLSTYAANGRRIQEFIIMDKQKKTTKFTFWEDFIDLYGNKLLKQLNEYTVILARKIGRSSSGSSNKFSGLSNKFSTTIYFNPPYPQAVELKSWAKTIEPMLNAYKIKSTSSTGSVMVVPFEDEIIAISNIQAQPQVLYVEAELCLPNENQRFCVLVCSDCKQLFTRSFSRRIIYCTNCQRSTHLIPRCQFEVTVRDNSGFATAIISDKPAEKMLCLSSKEIYDIYHVKDEVFSTVDHRHFLKLLNVLRVAIKTPHI